MIYILSSKFFGNFNLLNKKLLKMNKNLQFEKYENMINKV